MRYFLLCILAPELVYVHAGSNLARPALHAVQDIASVTVSSASTVYASNVLPEIENFLEPSASVSATARTSQVSIRPWNSSSISNNACDCTVNAVAGLVWWYPEVLLNVLGRISTIVKDTQTSFSYEPRTTVFDAEQALKTAGASISYGESWDAAHNTTDYFSTAMMLATPTAALTIFTSVSDIHSKVPTSIFGVKQLLEAFISKAPSPTYVVSVPGGSQAFLSATPYDNILYLTQLEAVYGHQVGTNEQSRTSKCANASPLTRSLNQAIAIPFQANEDLRAAATPTGTLDSKLLGYLPTFTNCVPGTWVAPSPTMIVVIEVTVERNRDVEILVHQEKTEASLDGPRTPLNERPSNGVPLVGFAGPGLQDMTPTPSSKAGPAATSDGPESYNLLPPQITPIAVTPPSGLAMSIPGQVITPNDAQIGFIIDGQTLVVGQVITQGGSNVISIDANPTPSVANINGVVQPLTSVTQAPALYVAGTPVPQRADGAFVVDGQTLLPGESITVAGTTLSLGSGARPSTVVVNGITSSLSSTTLPVLGVSGTMYTATPLPGPYIISGQTLAPGGHPITISGTTLSLQPGGSVLVVNGHTSTFHAPTVHNNSTSTRAPLVQSHSGQASLKCNGVLSVVGSLTVAAILMTIA